MNMLEILGVVSEMDTKEVVKEFDTLLKTDVTVTGITIMHLLVEEMDFRMSSKSNEDPVWGIKNVKGN